MTRDEAIAMVHIQLGFRSDQTTNIITCLKIAQGFLETEPTKPWFLLSEKATTTTVADEERVALPTTFLMEHEENGLRYLPTGTDTTPVRLNKDNLDQLEDYYGDETGPPEAYSLDGKYMRIFPLPDDVYTLEMFFYKRDTVLDTNIENMWLRYAPKLLMGEAGVLIAGGLRDATAGQIFSSWRKEGRDQLFRDTEARKATNTNPQIGGEH